ncbi:hypothetical protein FBUS_10531 [Fasciolopsis buskii]|uniref:Uncharacterized protein n=1 Tax=Fasciolopsis buskii TaxID=27845 RepID=A0A8E0RXX5_9TREM|nr:hypothetical protein FBUS_10531 [Fasciolopsis buski]
MGMLGKLLCMLACALGVMCTLAAIIEQKDEFRNDYLSDAAKASLGCLVIAFFIFAGALVFLFITLCCACSDTCMGTIIAVAGVFGCKFHVSVYWYFHTLSVNSTLRLSVKKSA